MKTGIIGGGAVGGAFAKLAVDAGHDVLVGSRSPASAGDEGWVVGTPAEAASHGEVVLVAVPLFALSDLPAEELAGRLVLDAMNYYPDRDGAITELDMRRTTTSELVVRHLSISRVIRLLNAILASDLPIDSRPVIGSVNGEVIKVNRPGLRAAPTPERTRL